MIYLAIASLDGYVADAEGRFDWAQPDAEVHAFANELERQVGTHLYGRRMYETMAVWEDMDTSEEPAVVADYAAIWRTADKVVYSRTLAGVSTARTRLEREFDPGAVRELEAGAERPLSIGGAELAAHAFAAGLVDDLRLIVAPVLVGAGRRALPAGLRLELELREHREFDNGMVYLRYGRPAGRRRTGERRPRNRDRRGRRAGRGDPPQHRDRSPPGSRDRPPRRWRDRVAGAARALLGKRGRAPGEGAQEGLGRHGTNTHVRLRACQAPAARHDL